MKGVVSFQTEKIKNQVCQIIKLYWKWELILRDLQYNAWKLEQLQSDLQSGTIIDLKCWQMLHRMWLQSFIDDAKSLIRGRCWTPDLTSFLIRLNVLVTVLQNPCKES